MTKLPVTADTTLFSDTLAGYKTLIETDITRYATKLERDTLTHFGANARLEVDAYLSILQRGGKRIRGSLAMLAYEMCGGRDTDMITATARALEMLHAYILIIDDFQDRSAVRRGGPTAHVMLTNHHRRHELASNAEHFGASIALNAALTGAHAAQEVLLNLDVVADRKIQATRLINQTMMVTAHGQTNDIINEVVAEVSGRDIERVLEWKTAHYTFLNPLSVGMVLAGADEHSIAAIKPYAIHAGKAFQITDDILGTFGTEFDSGKSPMDDIREGKRTLLTAYALEHTNNDNKNFLVQMLGNASITPVEFERCKDILVESGALAHAQSSAEKHVRAATEALTTAPVSWSAEGVQFLRGLALSLLGRVS